MWYTKFRSVATYGRGIGEIFLLNIGLPFNPLKMAQFIKLTGGLLIIIEIWGYSKIETCVSTILRLRSYVIQSKWACFLQYIERADFSVYFFRSIGHNPSRRTKKSIIII